jgi:hypothetical protein
VLPSNSGAFERADFDTVWEAKLSLKYEWRRWLVVHAGYGLMIWTNPVRPGDQVTPVNLSQVAPGGLVGPLEPHIPWKTDLFWVHGGNVGLEIRW